jgi:hypothetical protein
MHSSARSVRISAVAIFGAVALVVPAMAYAGSSPASPQQSTSNDAKQTLAQQAGLQKAPKSVSGKPKGPNPYLALLRDPATADYAGWKKVLADKGKARSAKLAKTPNALATAAQPILVDEDEPAGVNGSNDTTATAQFVDGFGTGRRQNNRARVLGQLSPQAVTIRTLSPNTEDDGAIPLARDTGIVDAGAAVRTTGTVGDGPHGSAGTGTGDLDYYKLSGKAGSEIVVQVTGTTLADSMAFLWDSAGNLVAFNDDAGGSFNSLLRYSVPADGNYYAAVTGYPTFPSDPNDPASGDGADEEGTYSVLIGQESVDRDFYAVSLRPGDVVSTSIKGGATQAAIFDPAGREVHGSGQDASSLYPLNSPLPGGGNAVTEHVAASAGDYYIAFTTGTGTYDATVEVYRPTAESESKVQTLFLDFDGARINTGIFGGPGVRELSPFRAFLGRWGLTRADENALIRRISATVEENVKRDLQESGLAGQIRLQVKNSLDHPDTFGQENVSRVIVGGTIAESGIETIGIAQYIDPGNYGHEDSALVLLDALSDTASEEFSLNHYITAASNRSAFVAQAVANVTSHEAGHFFGNWHTDQFDALPNLMDQGGEFAGLFGVGPDGIGGTADDIDVDFGEDTFVPNEGFTGIEDTAARTAFGLGRR